MLSIEILTLFPQMIEEAVQHGLLGQALKKNLLALSTRNPRDFTRDRHRSVDDRPFGGGDGMVMLPEVLEQTLQAVLRPESHVVYLSPQGETLTSQKARTLGFQTHLVLICGRYGGIDQRIINHYVNEEISIGDYVLSGGEIAALVVTEAISRFIPGVLGHEESSEKDSFTEGLLEQPQFTRPREFKGETAPDVLLSGNHALIAQWKKMLSLLVTRAKRPDLFKRYIKLHSQALARGKKTLRQQLEEFDEALSPADRNALGLKKIDWKNEDV